MNGSGTKLKHAYAPRVCEYKKSGEPLNIDDKLTFFYPPRVGLIRGPLVIDTYHTQATAAARAALTDIRCDKTVGWAQRKR
jgi:hypothetical protein